MQAMSAIRWQWCRLQALKPEQLYALFAAREAVFVVEQNCAYQELDGLDIEALHLIAWSGDEIAACLRVMAPGVKFEPAALGRIMTTKAFRGRGLGRELMARALRHVDETYPDGVRISAQTYLEKFYRAFGFSPVSDTYLEDGIPHVEMLRPPS
jgi:ElaA protein